MISVKEKEQQQRGQLKFKIKYPDYHIKCNCRKYIKTEKEYKKGVIV